MHPTPSFCGPVTYGAQAVISKSRITICEESPLFHHRDIHSRFNNCAVKREVLTACHLDRLLSCAAQRVKGVQLAGPQTSLPRPGKGPVSGVHECSLCGHAEKSDSMCTGPGKPPLDALLWGDSTILSMAFPTGSPQTRR